MKKIFIIYDRWVEKDPHSNEFLAAIKNISLKTYFSDQDLIRYLSGVRKNLENTGSPLWEKLQQE